MKKRVLLVTIMCSAILCSAQSLTIEVNVSFVLEGTITSKKGGKLTNAPVSIYGWNKVWIITTNDKGYYRVDLTSDSSRSTPPNGMDGQEKIIFYYSDKRYSVIPTKDIKMEEGDVDGLPVGYLDVRL
jgi:hypothetical protein